MVTISQDVVLVSYEEKACLHIGTCNDKWVIDTIASYDSISDWDLFITYKTEDHDTTRNMRNTSSSIIVGIGDVHIITNVGCI